MLFGLAPFNERGESADITTFMSFKSWIAQIKHGLFAVCRLNWSISPCGLFPIVKQLSFHISFKRQFPFTFPIFSPPWMVNQPIIPNIIGHNSQKVEIESIMIFLSNWFQIWMEHILKFDSALGFLSLIFKRQYNFTCTIFVCNQQYIFSLFCS